MNVDVSLWNNKIRLRDRFRDMAKIVLSLSAVNGYYALSQRSWIIFGINVLFFVTTIPVFVSWSKFQKLPPEEEK